MNDCTTIKEEAELIEHANDILKVLIIKSKYVTDTSNNQFSF